MAKIHLLLTLLFLSALTAPLSAADKEIWDKYNNLKDDGDLYVGEGLAKASEFGGDVDRAKQAARERAREDLGASVRVEVRSKIQEQASQANGQSSESIKSSGQSESAVTLENVKFREFKDFPHDGDDTVLAYLSKEDYRRQLAGKAVSVYRPQFGVGITGGILNLSSMAALQNLDIKDDSNTSQNGIGASMNFHSMQASQVGVKLSWPFLVCEVSYATGSTLLYANDGQLAETAHGPSYYQSQNYSVSLLEAKLGYDITPWAWRYQPYLPLRLLAGTFEMEDSNNARTSPALLFGASAGLGFRYWFMDGLALELSVEWQQGFNSFDPEFPPSNHRLQIDATDYTPPLDLSGLEFQAGLRWSGF